jgi:hypothetical protein
VLNANRTFLFFDVSDFKSASIGGEWLVPFGEFFEGGAGIGFTRRTVPTVYTDFVDIDGSEIEQELRLRTVPFSFTVRALPLAVESVPAVSRRRSERGELAVLGVRRLHRLQQQPRDLPRLVCGERHGDGPVVLGGIRFGGETLTRGGEIRYSAAKADLPSDFAGNRSILAAGPTTSRSAVAVRAVTSSSPSARTERHRRRSRRAPSLCERDVLAHRAREDVTAFRLFLDDHPTRMRRRPVVSASCQSAPLPS